MVEPTESLLYSHCQRRNCAHTSPPTPLRPPPGSTRPFHASVGAATIHGAEGVPMLGRRGRNLLVLGSLWALLGVGYLLGYGIGEPPQPPPPERWLFHATIPAGWIAALWLGPACLAVSLAWTRAKDRFVYPALFVGPALFSASYLWSFLVWVTSGGTIGYDRGLFWGAVWSCAATYVVQQAWTPETGTEVTVDRTTT